jgi:hypothetical protein
MDENFAPEPRMKPIENLLAGSPVGVLKPRSTIIDARILRSATRRRRNMPPISSQQAIGCATPTICGRPFGKSFLTCRRLGRLQPYVRPLCAAVSWPLALMLFADRIPNQLLALIALVGPGYSDPRHDRVASHLFRPSQSYLQNCFRWSAFITPAGRDKSPSLTSLPRRSAPFCWRVRRQRPAPASLPACA